MFGNCRRGNRRVLGKTYTLTPDFNLTSVPVDTAGRAWWQDADGKLYIRNLDGSAQGFRCSKTHAATTGGTVRRQWTDLGAQEISGFSGGYLRRRVTVDRWQCAVSERAIVSVRP